MNINKNINETDYSADIDSSEINSSSESNNSNESNSSDSSENNDSSKNNKRKNMSTPTQSSYDFHKKRKLLQTTHGCIRLHLI